MKRLLAVFSTIFFALTSVALADSTVPALPLATTLSLSATYLAQPGASNNQLTFNTLAFCLSGGSLTICSGGISSAMLSSGAALSNLANGSITSALLTPTGVAAGSYTNLNATINPQGQITVAANGSSTGSPGGSSGQGQWNNGGSFAGSSGLTLSTTKVTSLNIGLGSDATGDTYYNGGSGVLTRLGIGSTGQVLTVVGGVPGWLNATGGGNFSVTGPVISNNVVSFSGTSGTTGQDSGIASANVVTATGGLTAGIVPMGGGSKALVLSEIADTASGGVTIGSPTGGQKGPGTINMTGCFINNVACASGSSPSFSSITGGTNTSAPMIVGTGASLTASGSGSIVATTMPTTGLTGILQAAQFPALGGDVSTSAGSLTTTIGANIVTNVKSAQMVANTVKGNFTGSTANAADNSVPGCTDTGGNHLNYTLGSGITCGTSSSVGATTINLNPGFSSNPSVYNAGAQQITNSSTLSSQLFSEAHATSYTLASTDGGKLPYFTAASQTATFPNPGSPGSTVFNFGYDGSHTYSITTSSGSASIYGCGTAGTTVSGLAGQIQLVPDPFGNYQCIPNFSVSGASGVASLTAGTPDLVFSASTGAVTASSTLAAGNPTTVSYTILSTDAAKTVDRTYTAGAMTDTLPNVSASGFGVGFKFSECADSTQQITLSVNSPSTIFGKNSIIIQPGTCVSIGNPLGTNYVAYQPSGVTGPVSSTNNFVPQWSGTTGQVLSAGLAVGTSGGVLSLLNANKTDSGSNTYSGTNTFAGLETFAGTVVGANVNIAATGNLDGTTACGNTVHYTGAGAGTITLLANTVPANCNFAVDATSTGLATMAVAAGGTQVSACTTARTRASHSILWVHVESNAGTAPVVNVSGDCG